MTHALNTCIIASNRMLQHSSIQDVVDSCDAINFYAFCDNNVTVKFYTYNFGNFYAGYDTGVFSKWQYL